MLAKGGCCFKNLFSLGIVEIYDSLPERVEQADIINNFIRD